MRRAFLALAVGLSIAAPATAQEASAAASAPSTAAELNDLIDACGDEARDLYLERVALSTRGAAAERDQVMSFIINVLKIKSVAEGEQQVQLGLTRERERAGVISQYDLKVLRLHKCIMTRRIQQIQAFTADRP